MSSVGSVMISLHVLNTDVKKEMFSNGEINCSAVRNRAVMHASVETISKDE